jgi:hypothetical protein
MANYNLLFVCVSIRFFSFSLLPFTLPFSSLWLCHNELQNIEDMSSIAKSINLKEITIENNPISLAGDCVSFLVSYLPLLNSLNQLQITEQGELTIRDDICWDLKKGKVMVLRIFRRKRENFGNLIKILTNFK